MNKIKVLVEDATLEQLIAFAEASLGLPTPPANIKRETMLAKVKTVYQYEDFELSVEAPAIMTGMAPEGRTVAVPVKVAGASDPKVKIILQKHEKPGGDRAEFFSVNGIGMMIPRGEAVTIPYRYYEVLKNAVEAVYIQNEDGSRTRIERPAFQYQILSIPDERAVADYIERTADEGRVLVTPPVPLAA